MRRRDRPHLRPNTLSIPAMGQMQQQHSAAAEDLHIGGSLAHEHHVHAGSQHRHHDEAHRARKGGVIITSTSRHRLQTQQSKPDLLHHADSPVPKIKCNFVSAPSTPLGGRISGMATSWAEGDLASYMSKGKMYGSIGSVDEAQEAAAMSTSVTLSPARYSRSFRTTKKEKARAKAAAAEGKSKSRLSLNLNLSSPREERSPSPTPSATSARSTASSIIPRFLRNSFSRLMGASSRKTSPAVTPGAISPSSTYVDSPEMMAGGVLHESPSMAEYIEETKQSGLPVIPFAHPTSVVAEKMKNRSRTTSINAAPENKAKNVSSAVRV
jgi:hypothetical protein